MSPVLLFHLRRSPFRATPPLRPGAGSHCGSCRFANEGCHRTGILGTRFLQLFVCHSEGHRWLAAGYRSFSPQPLCRLFAVSYGNVPFSPPIPPPRGLDGMVSIDLQDIYLQFPVQPESRRFLRFCVGHQTFQFQVLCFGLSSALQVFTRVMAPISSIMHCYGYRILRYLDDWLVLGSSLHKIVRARDFLLWLCRELGVQVNLSKSSLTPTQTLDCLGMTLQSSPLKAFPTQIRIHKVLSLIAEFSFSREQPVSLWWSLLGVMSSMSMLILGACLRMRSLQLRLNVVGPQTSEDALISWDNFCHLNLRWWSVASHLDGGVSLGLPHPQLLLFMDASDSGWGATLGDNRLSGLWSRDVSTFSINHRDLLAVLLAVRGFLHLLRGQSVSFTDNSTALSYLRKEGGTRSSTLNVVAQAILHLCEANAVHLLPQFVPGRLNVLADSVSHGC